MASIKLGELLVRANVITEGQLRAALTEQAKWGGKLGEILVRMEFCSEEILVKALARQLNLQRAELEPLPSILPEVLAKIPLEASRDFNALPLQLRDDGKTLVVAMADPQNLELLDTLRARTGCRIVPLIAGPTAIAKARSRLYYGEEELDSSAEGQFKVTDVQGRTLVKAIGDLSKVGAAPAKPAVPPPPAPPPVAAARPPPPASQSPSEQLAAVEAVQRKEVAALKAMVEILIEKGVFSREEYLARVKR